MKLLIRLSALFALAMGVSAQTFPLVSPTPYSNQDSYKFAPRILAQNNLGALPDAPAEESVMDYRWKDDHEKERNVAFAASAASLIAGIYTATRSIEARSRAADKYEEYQGLWYGSSEDEFARVKKEHKDLREDGNLYSLISAGFGALSLLGFGFAVYWSF